MKKYLLLGLIGMGFVVFYFLIVLVVFYFLLGLTPVLWMAGMFAVLVLLRFVGLQLTKTERKSARCTGKQPNIISSMLANVSFVYIILLTLAAGRYLFDHFGWLAALLYVAFSFIAGGMFEALYEISEALDASEIEVA